MVVPFISDNITWIIFQVVVESFFLQSYGLELLVRTASSFTPMLEDGVNGKPPRSLLLSSDTSKSCSEISKFSHADAKVNIIFLSLKKFRL